MSLLHRPRGWDDTASLSAGDVLSCCRRPGAPAARGFLGVSGDSWGCPPPSCTYCPPARAKTTDWPPEVTTTFNLCWFEGGPPSVVQPRTNTGCRGTILSGYPYSWPDKCQVVATRRTQYRLNIPRYDWRHRENQTSTKTAVQGTIKDVMALK